MIYDPLPTDHEGRVSQTGAAEAVRKGQVSAYDVEADDDYIPPSWRGKKAAIVPVSE